MDLEIKLPTAMAGRQIGAFNMNLPFRVAEWAVKLGPAMAHSIDGGSPKFIQGVEINIIEE